MKLNRFFGRDEFACKCGCGFNTVDAELLHILTRLRNGLSSPVSISSGCRCAQHNQNEGGTDKSQHLIGRAADITVHGVSPGEVYQWLNSKYPNKYGMGRYDSFTHFDTRSTKARW